MPENEKYQGDEKLLILPLGEESKKITQVISNDTARQIIELLADAPLCASDIVQRLQAPLTTITYNLENLESVGLIKVEKIKYSEKGREVKIYAPVRKLIVLVPEKTDRKSVVDMLRKYMGVIMAAVLASSFIEILARSVSSKKMVQIYDNSLNETLTGADVGNFVPTPVATTLAKSAPVYAANSSAAATPSSIQPSIDNVALNQAAPDIFTNLANTISTHPGLVFFMGCMFVIALFIIMDYSRKRKRQ